MRPRAAIHFILLGAALFALTRARVDGRSDAARPPSAAGAAGGAASEEETLYRAALARGLDRDDPVVRARLVQNMRFLAGASADAESLYRDARRLGLADADLVVRRRLVDRMRRVLEAPALAGEPGDAELQAYLADHAERFALPARTRLTQVFLSRRRRGAALAADAARLRARLTADDVGRAAALGDPLPLPADLPPASAQDLARWLGPELAAQALRLEPGRWHGPLASPYGLHVVWVHEREAARLPALHRVRGAVRAALLEERAAAAVRDGLGALRAGAGG